MEITLEQIDLLKKRANIGYKEAKEVLEKYNGSVVEALAHLEEEQKLKSEKSSSQSSFWQKIKNLIAWLNQTSLVISKKDSVILNLPLAPVLLLVIISLPLAVIALALALITGCRVSFKKSNGQDCEINRSIDKVGSAVSSFTQKVSDQINNP